MAGEELDYDALIRQMWGSEEILKAFLDSEVPRLCSWICGSEAPSPVVKVTYPPLNVKVQNGVPIETEVRVGYRAGPDGSPPTILIPAVIAGYRQKLPQFIAKELVHHWEALGAIGEVAFDYPYFVHEIISNYLSRISEEEFKERYSPRFIAKAIKVSRTFEISLEEFLFPQISLTVHMPGNEENTGGSS